MVRGEGRWRDEGEGGGGRVRAREGGGLKEVGGVRGNG